MGADELARRRSAWSGRHRRDSPAGRHRIAVGALRLVEHGDGEWSLKPVTRPTHYVGRVGALAVALGVGGMPAVAAADPGSPTGTDPMGSTQASEAPSVASAATPRDSRPGTRMRGGPGPDNNDRSGPDNNDRSGPDNNDR